MAADRIIDEAADAPLSGIIMIAYPRGRSAAEGWAWIDGAGHDDPAMGAILDAMEGARPGWDDRSDRMGIGRMPDDRWAIYQGRSSRDHGDRRPAAIGPRPVCAGIRPAFPPMRGNDPTDRPPEPMMRTDPTTTDPRPRPETNPDDPTPRPEPNPDETTDPGTEPNPGQLTDEEAAEAREDWDGDGPMGC